MITGPYILTLNGDITSPVVKVMKLDSLPKTETNASSSMYPRSPNFNQLSSVMTSLVSASLFKYPIATLRPQPHTYAKRVINQKRVFKNIAR